MLTDSIGKDLGRLPGVKLVVKRGGYIEHFSGAIQSGDIVIKGMNAILIHAGTNNMSRDRDPHAVLYEMGRLLRVIRLANPNVHVIVSTILPRVEDSWVMESLIKCYNNLLVNVCRETSVMLIRSYNAFRCSKAASGVKQWLYANDGLHLNARGAQVLTQMFRVHFSDRNIQQRRLVLDAEGESRALRASNFGYKNAGY